MKLIKQYATHFEIILDREFDKSPPPIVIGDNVLLYRNLKIIYDNGWQLRNIHGDILYIFNLKLSAMLAASYYSDMLFNKIKELVMLDTEYMHSINDIKMFTTYIKQSKDLSYNDILYSRMDFAKGRSGVLKKQLKDRYIGTFG